MAANAEIRTGSHGNPYADEGPAGSPTHPKFESVSLRYDTTAATIEATIRFETGLADPTQTSALRPYSYAVTLGDYLGSVCTGGPGTWLELQGRLGDDAPGALVDFLDLNNRTPNPVVTEEFNADRSALMLRIADPRLAELNLMCAAAEIRRDDDDRFRYGSSSFSFLLDGFSRLDGELVAEAESSMRDNIEFLDRDLGRPGKSRDHLNLRIRCARRFRDTVRCDASGTLRSTPGRPRITVKGDLVFPQPYRSAALGPRWNYTVNGRLAWRRCPSFMKPPPRLRGRPCQITVRWRGTRDLSSAVLR
jgi:hypothetical protein